MDSAYRPASPRLVTFLLSLVSYALAVSYRVQQVSTKSDQRGCVDPHALQYSWILLTGVIAGLAVGPWLVSWARRGTRAFMTQVDEASRWHRIRAVAISFILLGMAIDFLWVIPRLNVFIDLHRPLLVEVDVILYAMGTLSGASWFAILDRQSWLGLLVTLAMSLMIMSSVLSGHGWC